MKILLELIATSSADCTVIEEAGGDRIELCAALALGGLTPSAGLVAAARAATKLPIMMMLRPREGGFAYSDAEFAEIERDLAYGLAQGIDGFVFGCLAADGTIDIARTARIVKAAAGKQTVFHRAFDVTPDPVAALETLIELGVTRILTSGQQETARAGAELIRELVARAAGRIELLPGAGIRADHVFELIRQTGVTQIHASASTTHIDPSTRAHPELNFGGHSTPSGEGARIVDPEQIAALRREMESVGD